MRTELNIHAQQHRMRKRIKVGLHKPRCALNKDKRKIQHRVYNNSKKKRKMKTLAEISKRTTFIRLRDIGIFPKII